MSYWRPRFLAHVVHLKPWNRAHVPQDSSKPPFAGPLSQANTSGATFSGYQRTRESCVTICIP